MSAAKKGKPPNNKGKARSAEACAKSGAYHKGRPKSEAWKAKVSARMLGNTNGRVANERRRVEAERRRSGV